MDNNKDFVERLNFALNLRNYPAHGRGRINYLQEIFNISRAGANKWLHGKSLPHPQKREEIAEKLGINLVWLETGIGDPLKIDSTQYNANNYVFEAPLVSLADAYHLNECILNNTSLEKIVVSSKFEKDVFAVKLVGNSMAPRFIEGSILIVDRSQNPRDGDFVLAHASIIPEAIFRQYITGSNGNYLVAFNDKFNPIKIDDSTQVIGKIIEIRTEL